MTSIAVDVSRVDAALALETRLSAIPESAQLRGVFFNQLSDALRRELGADARSLQTIVGLPKQSYKLYPARDYARNCAIAGALVDADPLQGMRRLASGMASFFASTWYGRMFQRVLRPDPMTALHCVTLSRDYVANHGHFRLERRGPTHALMHFYDEYCWIEACQRGGCEGLLVACGVRGTVDAELDTPFRGRLDVRWTLD